MSRQEKSKRKASRRARTRIDIDALDPLPPTLPPRLGALDIFSRLAPVLTGRELREVRITQGWGEGEFAERLRISLEDQRALESSPDPVPERVADVVCALMQERAARLALAKAWMSAMRGRRKRSGGRPAVKRQMFLEAKRLRDTERISWPEIARRLDPNGFKEDSRKAGERMRLGVTSLPQTKSPPTTGTASA
jgi:hypothetical protein